MKLPILTAADGAGWEAGLLVALETGEHGVAVVRRCVDVVDLLAAAAAGQARAALVAAGLPRLDADCVDRLGAVGVVPVGMLRRGDSAAEARLGALGIEFLVTDDAAPSVVAAVIAEAVARADDAAAQQRPARAFSDPAAASRFAPPSGAVTSRADADAGTSRADADAGTSRADVDAARSRADADADAGAGAGVATLSQPAQRGSIVAVWGPTGAPGRSTVAVGLADELARLGCAALLVDADVYGGVIASMLGVLDESPGLAAACRQATSTRLDAAALAALSWQLTPKLRLLTGIPRAERWPELRANAVGPVLDVARRTAAFTVVDCGFCLESDEELSYDTLAPRRNGATLAVLDAADVILAVGAADPIGVQRLVRGLAELRGAEVSAPTWVVLNKVRRGVVPGDPSAELGAALDRFAGRRPAALLPHDPEPLDAALALGQTLGEACPNSALRHAIVEVAAALAGIPATRRQRAGWLGGPGRSARRARTPTPVAGLTLASEHRRPAGPRSGTSGR